MADIFACTISVFDRQGRFLRKFGGVGFEPPRLFPDKFFVPIPGFPLAVDGKHVQVAVPRLARVQRFTANGKYVSSIGGADPEIAQFLGPLGKPGPLRRPVSIALDKDGSLHVLDMNPQEESSEGRILQFNPAGKLDPKGKFADKAKGFLVTTPEGMAVVPSRRGMSIKRFTAK